MANNISIVPQQPASHIKAFARGHGALWMDCILYRIVCACECVHEPTSLS